MKGEEGGTDDVWSVGRKGGGGRAEEEGGERETPRVYFLSAFLTEQFVGKTIH